VAVRRPPLIGLAGPPAPLEDNVLGLGFPELLVIFVIVVFIFGANRMSSLGKGLGEGIRNFKKALQGDDENHDKRN
jgi:sec-independent protein translocase protein TatA